MGFDGDWVYCRISCVILLALDTCDSRGSVAVVRDGEVLGVLAHQSSEDYSSWLLPAVQEIVRSVRLTVPEMDVYAVASGPGSFTGLRVGLTTVKAWSEVFGKRIVPVSRLEALATRADPSSAMVAAFFDAHRGQVFGALYSREGAALRRVEDEMVIAPSEFVTWVSERAQGPAVDWVSMDPERVRVEAAWTAREKAGEKIQKSSTVLAPIIGKIGYERAQEGRVGDALSLDADYVRRSDAEIFWKGAASHGR
jgi:tRNA threonylcarbamoyladenosine biosynthesis protein TsaB